MVAADTNIVEDIKIRLNRPLALIGMMGAGKTRMGRQLADALNLPFVDSDDEIEKAAGMSIPEIFERFGEDSFRDGERRVLGRLLDGGVRVIATGGGAVMAPETASALWARTLTLWLRADLDVMLERTARRDDRPLLKTDDPEAVLKTLAEQRYPVYEKADIVVQSHNGPSEAILNQALDKIHAFLCFGERPAS